MFISVYIVRVIFFICVVYMIVLNFYVVFFFLFFQIRKTRKVKVINHGDKDGNVRRPPKIKYGFEIR